MKIIIATGIFPPDIGGPATYSEILAQELTTRGFQVAVISYADRSKNQEARILPAGDLPKGDKKQEYDIIRISRGYPKGLRHFIYFWKVFRVAKDADVVYTQDLISAGLPVLAAAKLLRKKFALKIVGDYAWEQYQNQKSPPKAPARPSGGDPPLAEKIKNIEEFQREKFDVKTELLRFLERLVARKADIIITPSEYLKKLVAGWGIDENKIKIIYNAYSGGSNSKLQTASYKLQAAGDFIISVGRLVPWKGFGALIEIMPDLVKENPNFKLLIVGEGPEREDLESRIKNQELEDAVILLGKLPHSELMVHLRSAKMFVLNTAYEGLSHQLLEALASGLPVITTNVCGNPEVITDGENGILVGFDDKTALKEAILRVWKDRALTEKFIQNGKKTLEKFKVDRMINETISQLIT